MSRATELTLFDVGDATLTPTALALPEDLSFEQWAWYGQRLVRSAASVLWWLGDWWAYGEHHYGQRKAATVLEGFPYAFQTCADAGWLARVFETSRRREVLPWSHHKEVAALPPGIADEFLEAAQINGWSEKELRQQVREWRRQQREQHAADLAAVSIRYPVIYADPPWRYDYAPSDSRAIENQYPTMDLDDLKDLADQLPVADDAVMFCWATSPKLAEALELLEAWELTYRTSMVWVKDKIGMGYYARQAHELLLIATRGELPAPAASRRPSSVVKAVRSEHSAKPEVFYELIERMYPNLPRIELFARHRREGWAAWGDEVVAVA